jgi:hypothetical protein
MSLTPSESVAFVVPYFDDGQEWRRAALQNSLQSIAQQTDEARHLYLVDDCSTCESTDAFVKQLVAGLDMPATLLRTAENGGPGPARNRGVEQAERDGFPLVAFLDSDDEAHPDRVRAVKSLFTADDELDFVYNDVLFVDEHGIPWESSRLLPVLRLINEQQSLPKLFGRERWFEHAVERDCLAIPSAVNVRTDLARRFPFPALRFCEDTNTVLRYLGGGAKLAHASSIPVRYRVPREGGSSSRVLAGGVDRFNEQRCAAERAGVEAAIEMAIGRGACDERTGREVLCRFLIRISRIVREDGSGQVALEQLRAARQVDQESFKRFATDWEQSL